jgi:trimeric autotransporter adhesin
MNNLKQFYLMNSSSSLRGVNQYLYQLANADNFEQIMMTAFGTGINRQRLRDLQQQWRRQDYRIIPQVEVLSQGELAGANGAYATSLDKIFVSSDFLAGADEGAIDNLLLEELGHKLDNILNDGRDSAGDEGAIFAALVQGQTLSSGDLARLRAENDHRVIWVNGQAIAVELETWTGDDDPNERVGTEVNDFFDGLGGNDTLRGADGDDTIYGGTGSDLIFGDDIFFFLNDTYNDYLYGEDGDDTIIGDIGNDSLSGGNGNDSLTGDSGNDQVFGENGDDFINGGFSDDTISGGSGNDDIIDDGGNDSINGDDGDDTISGGDGDDYINDGSGINVLDGGLGTDTFDVSGYSGSYVLNLTTGVTNIVGGTAINFENATTGVGNDSITGSAANNTINTGNGNDTINGGNGDDTLIGGTDNDSLLGEDGNDSLQGDSGNDTLIGGIGLDTIHGGEGIDQLQGDAGNDSLDGGDGDDVIYAGTDNDTLHGGAGNDNLHGDLSFYGEIGNDVINGGDGNDTLFGEDGNDSLSGDADADLLYGGKGNDTLAGGAGNDELRGDVSFYGEVGNDSINGNDGNDFLFGDDGNDTLAGDNGVDYLYGGNGNDSLAGGLDGDALYGDSGNDRIDGGEGNDIILGGSDNDTLMGAGGNDYFEGQDGADSIDGGTGNDNLYGGAGNDILVGGDNDDVILGDIGNDTLNGSSGNDYLESQAGDDILDGGTGNDALIGGTGNDTYIIDAVGDAIIETSTIATEIDTVQSSITYSLGANLEKLTLTGTAAVEGTGNNLNNIITGNTASNILNGGLGNDTLSGGLGDDTLIGGTGNDTYVVDSVDDIIDEASTIATEIDTVQSSVSYFLDANLENLILTGIAEYGTGNELNNTITGNTANNILNGGLGNDTLSGGTGNDTYIVDSTADIINEVSALATEIDIVHSSATYSLSANLEKLILIGTAAIDGTGNALNNTITGNSASNILNGGLGNDILNGGLGNDTLIGGTGNDTYTVDAIGDVVNEASTIATEIDVVYSSTTYSLGANVENLILTGIAAINGTGNALNNTITGNAANNILDGGLGNDTLFGGTGNDTYVVDAIGDVVNEVSAIATEIDTVQSSVTYSLGANLENLTLTGVATINGTGNNLNNTITGNTANNVLNGRLGNDTYIVDSIGDVVHEDSTIATEIDTIQSSVTYSLGANVENLILTGIAAIDGTGNALKNTITGNTANNILNGGLGNDTLIGGTGNDTYVVDAIGDVVNEASTITTEIDTVQSSITYSLGANLENLTLTGIAAINGTGNALNNIITGNTTNNILNGGLGNDTLIGGTGNDTYVVDTIGDVVNEASAIATEIDTVQSSITYSLGANLEHLTLTGITAINGTGNALNNTITGNTANNILDGGLGNDTLIGGTGNDTYIVDSIGDVVTETSTIATEIDTVQSSITYSLGANLENLTLTGIAAINGTGNALNNTITGNTANNILDGGLGNDTLIGGTGNDTYVVDAIGDVVNEASTIATEIDTVQSSFTHSLSANVENLILTGTLVIEGIGNDLNNLITANNAESFLFGGAGDDTLIGLNGKQHLNGEEGNDRIEDGAGDSFITGGLGLDTIYGGAGTDQLYGNEGNDYLDSGDGDDAIRGGNGSDTLYGGAGNDFIEGDVNLEIGDDVISGGNGNDTLIGSNGNDSLLGDADDDHLSGGKGNDYLDSGDGNDSINGGDGSDTLYGRAGIDYLGGNEGNDYLDGGDGDDDVFGGAGNDTLYGGTGNDELYGEIGNDIYGDIGNDVINGGDGNDTLIGEDGDDSLSGDADADFLVGGKGNDTLIGGAGNDALIGETGDDTLIGGTGNDNLNGGMGNDILVGETGDDYYFVDSIGDVVNEASAIATEIDTVTAVITYSLGANLENLILQGGIGTAIDGTGNALNNTITGTSANNILNGGLGNDTLIGGTGNDTYVVDAIGDVVNETSAIATEIDTVQSSITYSLGANLENLTLTGITAINGTGNALNNTITGNTANNILSGGLGNDTLIGDTGNDTYVVDSIDDIVIEASAIATEIDTVQSNLTYSLGANLENLTLTGVAAINGTGNALNNTITGNNASNILDGGVGNDTLNGGLGNDTLIGGTGNDTYVVDVIGDVVTETSTIATEIDTVQSSITYSLGANLEHLTLTGIAATNGTGNALNNTITGNTANNILNGGLGNDTLIGGTGNDTYVVDSIGDVVNETSMIATEIDTVQSSITYSLGANLEHLTLTGITAINGTGNALNNTITGNTANNILDGGLGNDTLIGGTGNDTYVVDSIGDAVNEASTIATEIDSVQSSVTYSLGANLENLTLTGITAINGTGNSLNNIITGNTANNILNGGLGNDNLSGGTGNDTYIIDVIGDVVNEASTIATEIDTVQSSITYSLGANLETLTLTGITAINGTGNALNNIITGNTANNILSGGLGNDTLIGGTGNDTYIIDSIGDVVNETSTIATEIDIVQASVTYFLAANVENLTLTGVAAINGTGNASNNVLVGNAANNILNGLAGNDSMAGGDGIDIYYVDSTGDTISETLVSTAASEIDYVYSTANSYVLSANIERLYLLTGAMSATGNTSNNLLVGNSTDNILNGDLGNDNLIGGTGNDTYVVDSIGDVVTETSTIATEIDIVQASVNYSLGLNLEQLVLTGISAINGTGNTLNNSITGNGAANILNGGIGSDTLAGGLGADTFAFQFGQSAATAADRLTDFAIGTDKIDLFTAAGLAAPAPTAFSRANDNTTATSLTTLAQAIFSDANGAVVGNQALTLGGAALVVVTGAIAGTYLIVDDGVAGFSNNDLVINISGLSGTLPALGTLAVNSFFL